MRSSLKSRLKFEVGEVHEWTADAVLGARVEEPQLHSAGNVARRTDTFKSSQQLSFIPTGPRNTN